MKNQIIFLIIVLIFGIWIAGCVIDKSTDELTPSDIINRTLEKSREVKTYKLEDASKTSSTMIVEEGKTTQIWNHSTSNLELYCRLRA
jgi:hypothetical protein